MMHDQMHECMTHEPRELQQEVHSTLKLKRVGSLTRQTSNGTLLRAEYLHASHGTPAPDFPIMESLPGPLATGDKSSL